MKITFVMPVVHQNGGCRVVAEHARNLLSMGHDVTVVSRKPLVESPQRRALNRLRRIQPVAPEHASFFEPLGERYIEVDRIGPRHAEDFPDADVIIATWWRTAYEVAALPPEKGCKAYFVQGHEVHTHLPWDLSSASYRLPLKKIVVSGWLADIMASEYGDHDVAKVVNSVDTDLFDAPPRAPGTSPTVGFIYSGTAIKGADIALAAIKLARQRLPGLQVICFGQSKPRPPVNLPSDSQYFQNPPQQKIPEIYARCDAWIVPGRSEGFGLPLLEAMACRTPVIATRTGAAEDFITNGVEGFVVDVDDAEAMATALIDVLSLPSERWRAMSDAAYARSHGWSWADSSRSFEEALENIVTENKAGP